MSKFTSNQGPFYPFIIGSRETNGKKHWFIVGQADQFDSYGDAEAEATRLHDELFQVA